MPSIPGTLNYPAALDDTVSLFDYSDNVVLGSITITQVGGIGSGDASVQINDVTGVPTSGVIRIDNEFIYYNGKTGGVNGTLNNLLRGKEGTAAAAHAQTAVVTWPASARVISILRDAIIQAETKLGIGATTPVAKKIFQGTGAGASAWQYMKDPIFDARNYLVADGVTDDSANIASAIADAANEAGGHVCVVLLPYAASGIAIANTVDIPTNIILEGVGWYPYPWGSNTTAGTVVKWTGAAGGTCFTLVTPDVTTDTNIAFRRNCGLRNMTISGAASAAIGILLKSAVGARLQNIRVINTTSVGIDINVAATITGVGDPQECLFENIIILQVLTAAWPAIGLRLDGNGAAGNTSYDTFRDIFISHKNGTALKLIDCDNNMISRVHVNRVAGGAAFGVELMGSNTGGARHARANMFQHLDPGTGGLISRGSPSGFSQGAVNNIIFGYMQENGAPDPIIEDGSQLYWLSDRGDGMLAADAFPQALLIDTDTLIPAGYGVTYPGPVEMAAGAVMEAGVGSVIEVT